MFKNRKVVLFIAAGSIGLLIIVLLLRFIINSQFRSQIPILPDSYTISQPVKEQISEALENANHKPTAENLGMLGMVYHSNANYEQASRCYKLAIKRKRFMKRKEIYIRNGPVNWLIMHYNTFQTINI